MCGLFGVVVMSTSASCNFLYRSGSSALNNFLSGTYTVTMFAKENLSSWQKKMKPLNAQDFVGAQSLIVQYLPLP